MVQLECFWLSIQKKTILGWIALFNKTKTEFQHKQTDIWVFDVNQSFSFFSELIHEKTRDHFQSSLVNKSIFFSVFFSRERKSRKKKCFFFFRGNVSKNIK